jgi:hypothetical protein
MSKFKIRKDSLYWFLRIYILILDIIWFWFVFTVIRNIFTDDEL